MIKMRFLFLALTSLLASSVRAGKTEQNYLRENSSFIEIEKMNFDFDPGFYENNLFFFGSVHGSQTPQKIDFGLLKTLNQNGVNYYAPEIDYSLAYFFNEYLNTGDAELLKFACTYQGYRVPQDGSIQLYEKWQEIYAYNTTLDEKDKLKIMGWDVRISTELCLTHLAFLAPEKPSGTGIVDSLIHFRNYDIGNFSIISGKPAWKSGKGWDYFFGTEKSRYFERFEEAYKKDSIAILNAFGENANAVKRIMHVSESNEREVIIHENFEKYALPKIQSGEKIYANYGYFHVQQSKINNYPPLAARVKTHEDVKVTTILGLLTKSECYKNAKMKSMGPVYIKGVKFKKAEYTGYKTSKSYDGDGLFERVKGMSDLKKIAGSEPITLFHLNRSASPYFNSIDFAGMSRGGRKWRTEEGKNTLDYFQHVILIQDSEGNVPLEELND